MTRHWEPMTLKLTAKQARVLYWLLTKEALGYPQDYRHMLASLRAILRKLEGE